MLDFLLLRPTLTLFDGAGGAAAGSGSAGAADGGSDGGTAAGAETEAGMNLPGSSRRAKKAGGLSDVLYGKQPEEQTQKTEPAAEAPKTFEERRSKFREMIESPEYKDVYTAEFQKAFDRRFRDSKKHEERLAKQQPILDALAKKYGISDGDVDKLSKAIDEDDSYWQEAADEAGMSVDQYKKFQKLQKENDAFRAARENYQAQQAAQTQFAKWQTESESLKAEYPSFDLATEAANPMFVSLLKSNVPVKTAYEVLHMDEIKGTVAKSAEKRVVDGIRVKGSRPAENGVSSRGAVTIKQNVSSLTRADRAEIARRVERGDHVEF